MTQIVLFSDTGMYNDKELILPNKAAGVHRIATELRQHGFSVQVINHLFSFSIEEIKELCYKFITNKTILVGFSTTFWYPPGIIGQTAQEKIQNIISVTRNLSPTAKIIAGGTNLATLKNLQLDHRFWSYNDKDIITYLTGKSSDFDFTHSQIIYDKDDCLSPGETLTIETARGCIFRCKFCAYELNGKKKFDYIKDPNTLKEELIRNHNDYGITNYIISDDTFNDSTYKLDLFVNMISKLSFKINFSCYLRLDLLHRYPEQIEILKAMGIKGAFFGIESFNYTTSKIIGKGIHPDVSKKCLETVKKEWPNSHITIGLVVGLPEETRDNLMETASWFRHSPIDSVNITALDIRPGDIRNSEFGRNPQAYGYDLTGHEKQIGYWEAPGYEISDRYMAFDYREKLIKAAREANLEPTISCFSLMTSASLIPYHDQQRLNVVSAETLFGYDYKNKKLWMSDINLKSKKYIENYKSKLI